MTMKDTGAKTRLYEYLKERSLETPPSVRELCEALSIKSTSTVYKLLHELEADGLLEIRKGQRRNIRVIGHDGGTMVPLFSEYDPALPLSEQVAERYLPFEKRGMQGLFAVRMQGDHMIGAGILDSDMLIVRPTSEVENGGIALVCTAGALLCRRISRLADGRITLISANADYLPVIPSDFVILGRLHAVLRYCEDAAF